MFNFKCHYGWEVVQVYEACGDYHCHGSWECDKQEELLYDELPKSKFRNHLTTHLDLVLRMYAL